MYQSHLFVSLACESVNPSWRRFSATLCRPSRRYLLSVSRVGGRDGRPWREAAVTDWCNILCGSLGRGRNRDDKHLASGMHARNSSSAETCFFPLNAWKVFSKGLLNTFNACRDRKWLTDLLFYKSSPLKLLLNFHFLLVFFSVRWNRKRLL